MFNLSNVEVLFVNSNEYAVEIDADRETKTVYLGICDESYDGGRVGTNLELSEAIALRNLLNSAIEHAEGNITISLYDGEKCIDSEANED